jgi:hypothetical protein
MALSRRLVSKRILLVQQQIIGDSDDKNRRDGRFGLLFFGLSLYCPYVIWGATGRCTDVCGIGRFFRLSGMQHVTCSPSAGKDKHPVREARPTSDIIRSTLVYNGSAGCNRSDSGWQHPLEVHPVGGYSNGL